jgi:hypothetical protein
VHSTIKSLIFPEQKAPCREYDISLYPIIFLPGFQEMLWNAPQEPGGISGLSERMTGGRAKAALWEERL